MRPWAPVRAGGRGMLAAAVVLAIGVVYVLSLTADHVWQNGDFAMYILHARNIVEGQPYMATGYLYNPLEAAIGPRAYPPGYPVLLTPVYAIFGLNLVAMKVQLVLFFALSLFLLDRIVRDELPPAHRLVLLPMVAFYPFFWNFRELILSDLPMLLFVLLSLYAFQRARPDSEESSRGRLAWAVMAGAAAFFAIMVRSAAVTLLPAFLAFDLLRDRRVTRETLVALAVAAGPYLLVGLLLPLGSGYTGTIEGYAKVYLRIMDLDAFVRNVEAVIYRLGGMWSNGYVRIVQIAVYAVTSALALIGFGDRLLRRRSVVEPFVVITVVFVMFWSATQHSLRYFVPVLPFYLFYIVHGLRRVQERFQVGSAMPLLLLALAVFGSYAGRYVHAAQVGEHEPGVAGADARQMFAYIREATDPKAIFIFRRPRILTLYTDRPAAAYFKEGTDQEMLLQFREFGARYVLVGPDDGSPDLQELVERNPAAFEPLRANPTLQLYRFLPEAAPPVPPAGDRAGTPEGLGRDRGEGTDPDAVVPL